MGFFDFIGDVFGTVTSPFAAVIDAGAKLLGLPPAITDALKVAVGAATGDVFALLDGGSKLLQDLAGKPAETEYVAPPKDEAFGGTDGWAATGDLDGASPGSASSPTSDSTGSVDEEAARALQTLRSSFDSANRDHGLFGLFGDKVITEKELRETAEDPEGSPAMKRAARYLLDHPDLLDSVARSRDGNDRGIAPADLDLALEDARAGRLSGTDNSPSSSGVSSTDDDELSALRTLQDSFDGINTQFNILFGRDKVLSQDELEKAAASPDSSPALKRALRYILDHPDLLDRLSRSKDPGSDVKGISRNDITLAIEDAQRSGGTGKSTGSGKTSTPAKTSGSGGPRSPAGTSSSGSTRKSSARSKDPSITDILNDKSLSVEEKIEMILLVLENRADDQMLDVTKRLDDNDSKKTAKDDRKKQSELDKVDRDLNFKMEKIVKRKEQLSNLLSTMEMKFASMAQTAIANMGR
jgi:hypothetical protein